MKEKHVSKDGDILDRLSEISIRRILLHPVFLFLVATMLVMTGAVSTWNRYQFDIVDVDEYELTRENILLTGPQPEWAKSDVRQMVLDQFADSSATTLEANLVPATARLFQTVGWVESVRRIEKTKDTLKLDLVYRDPVALVRIAGSKPWLPIDRSGVILDGEIVVPKDPSVGFVDDHLLIYVFKPDVTNLSTWQQWPDRRIQGAASICKLLKPYWQIQGIKQVVTLQVPRTGTPVRDYELRPKNGEEGTIIVWGSAPGDEAQGEATPEQKIAAINDYVLRNGSLEQARAKGLVVDVRSGSAVLASRVRTADQKYILKQLK